MSGQEYEFTLVGNAMAQTSDVPLSAVEETCSDCLVSSSEGRVRFDFTREGRSLAEAVGGAVLDLKKVGIDAWLESVERGSVVDAA